MIKIPEKLRIFKRFDTHLARARCELPYALENTDNPLHCEECQAKHSIVRMASKAIFKRKGSTYIMVCTSCGHPNIIRKGSMGEYLDKEFEGLY